MAQTPALIELANLASLLKCSTASFVIATGPNSIICAPFPAGITYSNGSLIFPSTGGTPIFGETTCPATGAQTNCVAGAINGTNAVFTLDNTPISGTVRVYMNGLRMCTGSCSGVTADYTISGAVITFNTASIPQSGDILLFDYSH